MLNKSNNLTTRKKINRVKVANRNKMWIVYLVAMLILLVAMIAGSVTYPY